MLTWICCSPRHTRIMSGRYHAHARCWSAYLSGLSLGNLTVAQARWHELILIKGNWGAPPARQQMPGKASRGRPGAGPCSARPPRAPPWSWTSARRDLPYAALTIPWFASRTPQNEALGRPLTVSELVLAAGKIMWGGAAMQACVQVF